MRTVEHAEHGRDCSGDKPQQRDPSERYADDPEFLRNGCQRPREEDDEDEDE